MSGGHYDCFYEWEDLERVCAKTDLIRAVRDDFQEKGMVEAADIIQDALGLLEGFHKAWKESPAAELCHDMDWYQSGDTSEDTMRERVGKTISEWREPTRDGIKERLSICANCVHVVLPPRAFPYDSRLYFCNVPRLLEVDIITGLHKLDSCATKNHNGSCQQYRGRSAEKEKSE